MDIFKEILLIQINNKGFYNNKSISRDCIGIQIKKENIRKRVKEIDNNDIKNKNKLYIKLIKENFVTL
jgi:hypothetical protein